MSIINEVKAHKKRTGDRTVLITFDPHPQHVLFPERKMKLLTTSEEKIERLKLLDLDLILLVKFDKKFSQVTGLEFIEEILVQRIGMRHCVIGYDHAFGKDRSGNYETLLQTCDQFDYSVVQVQPFKFNNEPVSSSAIRKFLTEGDIEQANTLLGYEYSLSGTVTKGEGRGEKLGFPTANIAADSDLKMIPAKGVYGTRLSVGSDVFSSITNVGSRPTFESSKDLVIETHVLDHAANLYGDSVSLEFLFRVRDEQKFDSAQTLIQQIDRDIEFVKEKLNI